MLKVMQDSGYNAGLPVGSINLVENTTRESSTELMKLNDYLDVIIPRGGAGLIKAVVENATVPSIETGTVIVMYMSIHMLTLIWLMILS